MIKWRIWCIKSSWNADQVRPIFKDFRNILIIATNFCLPKNGKSLQLGIMCYLNSVLFNACQLHFVEDYFIDYWIQNSMNTMTLSLPDPFISPHLIGPHKSVHKTNTIILTSRTNTIHIWGNLAYNCTKNNRIK